MNRAALVHLRTKSPAEEARAAALEGIERDITQAEGQAAHNGTSWTPEKRGTQEVDGYCAALRGDYDILAKYADTPEKIAQLGVEFARYRQGFREHYRAHLAARSRCLSILVCGPSRFPGARNQKRNRVADKRMQELLDFRKRALAAIERELRPELRPIMSGDSDATARLREKLAGLQAKHAQMLAANAAIRKHKKAGEEAQVAALAEIGYPGRSAQALLHPDFGRPGFTWEITNNGAEIRRVQARLGQVEQAQATEATEAQGEHATLEDSPADNRVRLHFPGKPAEDVRAALKSAGFRWAPSLGCWQAFRNERSLIAARRFAGI